MNSYVKKCPANVFDRTVMKYCEQLNYAVAKFGLEYR